MGLHPSVLAAVLSIVCANRVEAQPDVRGPQDPELFSPEEAAWAEGKIVKEILVDPVFLRDDVLRALRTKEGEPFQLRAFQEDLRKLAVDRRLVGNRTRWKRNADDTISLGLLIPTLDVFDEVRFVGLQDSDIDESELRDVLRLQELQSVSADLVDQYVGTILEFLSRRGYAYATVDKAPDPENRRIDLRVDPGPEVTIGKITIVGNPSFPFENPIGATQNLADGSRWQSKASTALSPTGEPFSERILQEDLDRLRTYYRRRGFLDAEVRYVGFVPLPAGRDDTTEEVEVRIRIEEGQRYRIRAARIEQRPPEGALAPTYPAEDLRVELDLMEGDFYDEDALSADRGRLESYYQKRGHVLAGEYGGSVTDLLQIQASIQSVDQADGVVDVLFSVNEGTPKTLRDVTIRGNTHTRDAVVRSLLRVEPGEVLDGLALRRSLLNVEFSGIASPNSDRPVEFTLTSDPRNPDLVDLDVKVDDSAVGRVNIGAAFNSANEVQGRFSYTKSNFDIFDIPDGIDPIVWYEEIANRRALHGGGQNLTLNINPGTQISTFQIALSDPDIFGLRREPYGATISAFRTFRALDSFLSDSIGGSLGFSKQFSDEFGAALTLRQETVSIENLRSNAPANVVANEGTSEIRALRGALTWSTIDNPFSPSKGTQIQGYAEIAGGFLGADEDFYKLGLNGTVYFTTRENDAGLKDILRIRAGIDYGREYGRSDVLYIAERFYLGGTNLRGFEAREAGPRQFDLPTAGTIRTTFSADYSIPFYSTRQEGRLGRTDWLRFVVFTDAGQLGLGLDDIGPLRMSVGGGFRIRIPQFPQPLSIYAGYPILEENSDRRQLIFIDFNIF